MGLTDTIFGSKPDLPDFKRVNAGKEQKKAIEDNLLNFDQVAQLAQKTNQLTGEQAKALLRLAIPNFDQTSQNIGRNIEQLSRGEIPGDVSDAVIRNANSRAVAGGFGGSQFGRNLEARDLGLTSLDLIDRGLDSASRWMAALGAAGSFNQLNPGSMFLTPAQRAQIAQNDNIAEFEAGVLQAQVDAAPSPFGAFLQRNIQSAIDDGRQIGVAWATRGMAGQVNRTPTPVDQGTAGSKPQGPQNNPHNAFNLIGNRPLM